jgi:DNA-binding transcriptional regulator YiaG
MDSELVLLQQLFDEYYEDEERRERESTAQKVIPEPPPPSITGGEMKRIRDAHRMKQSELAKVWKVEPYRIRQWEAGEKPIPSNIRLALWEMKK